ncbi:hypothetical protein ElyMa_006713100, partial [Elysia marginata]
SESEESRTGPDVTATPVNWATMRRCSSASQRLTDQVTSSPFWPVSVLRGRGRICSFETGSTTESELSSMSQIQEIEVNTTRLR